MQDALKKAAIEISNNYCVQNKCALKIHKVGLYYFYFNYAQVHDYIYV